MDILYLIFAIGFAFGFVCGLRNSLGKPDARAFSAGLMAAMLWPIFAVASAGEFAGRSYAEYRQRQEEHERA